MKRVRCSLFALGLVAAGCASSGSEPVARQDPNLITLEEIEAVNVGTLYEVVQRLRPRWLTTRGTPNLDLSSRIVVYQGQSFLGEVGTLRELGRDLALSLRYLDGPRASSTLPGLGSQHVQGAIIIETKKGR